MGPVKNAFQMKYVNTVGLILVYNWNKILAKDRPYTNQTHSAKTWATGYYI